MSNLRALIIDDGVRAEIHRLMEHAEANPVNMAKVLRTIGHPEKAVGNNPAHVCIVPQGYRCVFSIERQPAGMCRHLSISVSGDGMAPNPAAVEMLMAEFGFRGGLNAINAAWTEMIGPQKVAVNVVQRLSEIPVK